MTLRKEGHFSSPPSSPFGVTSVMMGIICLNMKIARTNEIFLGAGEHDFNVKSNISLFTLFIRGFKMKITLDEETIENIVNYVKSHPDEIKELIKIVGEEAIAVLMERKILEQGAKLYRAIEREINYTYAKEK